MRRFWLSLVLGALLLAAAPTLAVGNFPQLANYYLKTPITSTEAKELARYDLVILGMQAQTTSPGIFRALRDLNPNIKILAYVASQEIPITRLDELEPVFGPWHRLRSGIADDWWLRDSSGAVISTWPGNRSLNVTNLTPTRQGERWNTYLPRVLKEEVWSTSLWDGVFYDNVWDGVRWTNGGNLDVDRNGKKDNGDFVDQAWHDGMITMLKKTRQLLGDKALIVANGGQSYAQYLNGRLFEGFGQPWEGGWPGSMEFYRQMTKTSQRPPVTVVNFNSNNTGVYDNYRYVRFGLTSALLGDGYFAFDRGTSDHSQLLWYDEYDAALGQPIGEAFAVGQRRLTPVKYQAALYRREYRGGIALVNATDKERTVKLAGDYEQLRGQQDPLVNDGRVVNEVKLASQDGRVLRRTVDRVIGQTYLNGTFARVFNSQGQSVRNGFFASLNRFSSGSIVWEGMNDIVGIRYLEAKNNALIFYDAGGQVVREVKPYGADYTGQINFSVGDLAGNDYLSIVTVPVNDKPLIKVYNFRGQLVRQWLASNDKTGGSVVVIPRVGQSSLVAVGSGRGSPSLVKVFTYAGRLVSSFRPYGKDFTGGVSVAGGLVDGVTSHLITAPGFGAAPTLKLYTISGKMVRQWLAFSATNTSGVTVAVQDLEGDGMAEILSFTPNLFDQ